MGCTTGACDVGIARPAKYLKPGILGHSRGGIGSPHFAARQIGRHSPRHLGCPACDTCHFHSAGHRGIGAAHEGRGVRDIVCRFLGNLFGGQHHYGGYTL